MDLYRSSTALIIHSLAGTLSHSLKISIAFAIHSLDCSLDRSLFTHLLDLYWIPTALAIHSLAGALPRSLSTRLLDIYRAHYPFA